MSGTLFPVTSITMKGANPAPNLGPKPEFLWMPKSWLYVDAVYQRAMTSGKSRRLVRRITEEFWWPKFTPLTVTPLDWEAGKFAVVDGQHRAAAALAHPDVTEVPVWVVDAPDVRAQASVFVGVNADRNGMTTMQLFKAQLAAGDPAAVQVQEVCSRSGVTVAFHLSNGSRELPPRTTMAVSTIRKLIAKHGEKPVRLALTMLATAYADAPNQLRGQIIQAMTSLVVEHGDKIDPERLVSALAEKDCEDLLDAARQVKRLEGGTTDAGMVRALMAAYDQGLTPAKRLRRAA
ncbi:hypothetical protein E6C67_26670 [Azospirillum sp. TSA2s]|uniref:DUF6551 family protein n=1 Tax=Azospirillum sp. TSA2s TaxID=709810 RepID=UPI0010AAB212|nr:DUF6551 family protein [Azospirillum sp. TSA2s]QCG97359.1 hypothetical protein E6C67_26670 [Azospirillum sp. TSA2s]